MKSTAILIPARYASTRYPGKPLVKLDGVPMIKRVADAARESGLPVYVLTDDVRVANCVNTEYTVLIENAEYENGTERCAGALSQDYLDKYDQFVNVQGDMPDVTVEMIERCVQWLKYYPISTVWTDMPKEMQDNPSSVKMVTAGDNALWFGRGMTGYGNWHLGIYGYKRNPLEWYSTLELTTEEKVEKLEQLRWLKAGWDIGCSRVEFNGVEINTQEDIHLWNYKHDCL